MLPSAACEVNLIGNDQLSITLQAYRGGGGKAVYTAT